VEAAGTEIIDLLLGILMVILAGASLLLSQLFISVMAFIGLGLVVAVVWARLGAVDIALAEAMIGSGITGALFLAALGRMAREEDQAGDDLAARANSDSSDRPKFAGSAHLKAIRWRSATAAVMIASAAVFVILSVFPLPAPDGRIPALVIENLPDSGVSNPVTAVLLNFRAYDTLLEIGVVLLAVLGMRAVGGLRPTGRHTQPESVLAGFYRLILPVLIVFSGYMVWVGKDEPGGAFQAAALLAAGGIIGCVAGAQPLSHALPAAGRRIVVSAGFAVFLSLGVLSWIQSGTFLAFAPATAGWSILVIEVMATVSIALALIILFTGNSGALPISRENGPVRADRTGG
jgi:multisubunit Na+/H+ antiporter MnhB subunit